MASDPTPGLASEMGSLQHRPENPVLADPNDYGSREFWKAANHHAVRRWAEVSDDNVRLKGLLQWAETLLCNACPNEHCTQEEWDRALRSFRDQVNPVYKFQI